MPSPSIEPVQNKDASLFIGLQSYSEAQSDIFYGRDEETERLTNLVKANTLTIVFGKSGTGKTSLLNAGVFPRLRKDYCLPFRIRLEFNDDSPDLVTQIKNILKSEIDK
ncbi:MAG TPA: ATP-binding protein, partial [Ginsengibacter sp.]